MTTATFQTKQYDRAPGMILPQKLGAKLWAPMWVMALVAFAAAFTVAIVRTGQVADGAAGSTLLSSRHLQAGLMFIGFAAVFAAISFAIARILGVFRTGGGSMQAALGNEIRVLAFPATVRAFIVLMLMAMMTVVIASIVHLVFAASVASGSTTVADGEAAFDVLEGVRRLGVGVYLLSIAFGLAAIITVIRYQTGRARELVRTG